MNYVIIGGDAAGMSAAMQIFKYDKQAKITIIESGEIYSYAQCGLPYVISGDVLSTDDLIVRTPETYRESFGMNPLVNCKAQRINFENKTVIGINKKTNKQFQIQYDKLLIASGASPVIPNWEGIQFSNVHTLKDIPDLNNIINQLTDEVKDITIIGGGYIGLEMAESFQNIGKQVKIINRGQYMGNIFDEDMAKLIHDEAKKQGVDVILEENTEKIIGDGKAQYVVTDKTKHKTDLVLISIGIQPNTEMVSNTRIDLTNKGAIIVNKRMETNIKDIYAAGDCATQFHRIKGKDDYIPLGTHANKQGRIAGMNMSGINRSFKGIVGSSILKFFDLTLGRTGFSEKEAINQNIAFDTVYIEGEHIANYYPNPKIIYIKLLYETETLQLLGGQVIGEEGVDKRIDVLAVALFNKMTIRDLEDLDLSYAPPYNGVWDPLQRAARKAQNE